MRYKIVIICCLILGLLSCRSNKSIQSQSTNSTQTSDLQNPLNIITAHYTQWNIVRLNGKIKVDGLPIKPSTKIYMRKGELIRISLQAPLVGEVARIEIDNNHILIANKLKNVYFEEETEKILSNASLKISAIQDMLLGRAFLIDKGTITPKMKNLIDIQSNDNNGWIILPKKDSNIGKYAFNTFPDGKLSAIYAQSDNNTISTSAVYDYNNNDTEIEINFISNNKQIKAILTYNSPDWDANEIETLKISDKWKKVSFNDFLKSF